MLGCGIPELLKRAIDKRDGRREVGLGKECKGSMILVTKAKSLMRRGKGDYYLHVFYI